MKETECFFEQVAKKKNPEPFLTENMYKYISQVRFDQNYVD